MNKFYAFLQTNAGGFFRESLPGCIVVHAESEESAITKFLETKYSEIRGCDCGCGEIFRYSYSPFESDTLQESLTFVDDRPKNHVVIY